MIDVGEDISQKSTLSNEGCVYLAKSAFTFLEPHLVICTSSLFFSRSFEH